MWVEGFDERRVMAERRGTTFAVYVYEGDESRSTSWSVDSYLISDASLGDVRRWLEEHLPTGCCWSLGVVRPYDDGPPRERPGLEVAWIVGDDLLNLRPEDRTGVEQRVVEEMLERRERVILL